MQLKSFACVCIRLHACVCVCTRLHVCVCVCTQKIKCPDASRRKKSLRLDTSFVQGLSGCTIHGSMHTVGSNNRVQRSVEALNCWIAHTNHASVSCIQLAGHRTHSWGCDNDTVVEHDVETRYLTHILRLIFVLQLCENLLNCWMAHTNPCPNCPESSILCVTVSSLCQGHAAVSRCKLV